MSKKLNSFSGYSMIEMITFFIILSLVVFFSPIDFDFYQRIKNQKIQMMLISFLKSARIEALNLNNNITICKLVNNKCKSGWNNSLITKFIDINGNKFFNKNDKVLKTLYLSNQSKIKLQFITNRYIQFLSSGRATTFGTIIICSNNINKATAIIVNRAGRVRKAVDFNNNQIVEDGSGKDISCL